MLTNTYNTTFTNCSPQSKMTTAIPREMRAVVFKGVGKVALENRPVPVIKDPKDIIVKVLYTALCGRQAVPVDMLDHAYNIPVNYMSFEVINPLPQASSWAMNLPA